MGKAQTSSAAGHRTPRHTMNLYKITLRSGRASMIEDERSLSTLAADLAQDGFVIVRRQASGYSQTKTEVAIMERAVESIEPSAE
jgi:hypothetical protein